MKESRSGKVKEVGRTGNGEKELGKGRRGGSTERKHGMEEYRWCRNAHKQDRKKDNIL